MYNYKQFKSKEYDFSRFEGPGSGDEAVDFEATTLEGKKVKFSDYLGKWIVLETGSITCPIYESKIKPMNQLADGFPDVKFLVLYIREAHPGENIKQHESFEDKLSCARRAREEDAEHRTILVDDLEGTTHKKYGSMPNSVYVINPDGRIVMRGDWNSHRVVRKVLKERDPNKIYKKERYSGRPNLGTHNSLRALKRAGDAAVWDFIKAMPAMIYKHTAKLFK